MGTFEYILTPRLWKTLKVKMGEKKNNLGVIIQENRFYCRKCGKEFEIGDIVISKPIRNGKKVLYHKACYESTFVFRPRYLELAKIYVKKYA